MDVLKQARGHLKGAITKAHNYSLEMGNNIEIEVLEARLERLNDTWKDFCLNQNDLFQYHAEEGYGDPEVDFDVTEGKYIATKAALVKAIRATINSNETVKENTSVPSSSNSVNPHKSPEIELPPIKLPPFSGDYREWPGFRDMFLGSIDCKINLSGSQKLRYLKSFLRDDAAKLLNHINISDSNYEQAWEKLEHRYDKPLYIINAYIDSFLKLPTVTHVDGAHLRKLVDSADEVVRGLKSIKAEGRDPWLIYMLLNKTDIETRKEWALENRNSEESTIKELIAFLEERCDALEASETKGRVCRNAPRSVNSSGNVRSLAVTRVSCPKCKDNHLLPQCPQFVSMPIHSRRSFVRDQRLCYNCLGTQHSSSRCRVRARCSHCNTRHHSLVHLDVQTRSSDEGQVVELSNEGGSSSSASVDPTSIVSHHIKNQIHPSGILPTVVVKILDALGKTHLCRLLLDTGSQVSFVSESLVKRLGLHRRHARLPISGISSVEAGVTRGAVTLQLQSCINSFDMELEAYILNKITSQTPLRSFEIDSPLLLENLQWADPGFNKSGPIDILLGSDKAWSILRDGHRSDKDGQLIAQNTVFGWVITGSIPDKRVVSLQVGLDLDILLKSFWEIEEVGPHLSTTCNEEHVDAHFADTFSRTPDSKYMVELPFRHSDVRFGNTLSGALSRLSAMERRFSRCEDLRSEYCNFMKVYEELGHMERIPNDEIEPTSGKVFYLPHHAVVTNKIRVVFDGSHKDTNGLSLNEMLHVGPPLQRNLINVCIRFRLHKYVFCADIVKMFRQIWVNANQRDFQRIVWRGSTDEPISHFRLCTVTYGTSPAPYLAMRVLRQLAIDYQHQFPIASHSILHDFYVDDIMSGSDSLSEVLELKQQLVELLSCGGLQLSKWSSNCWTILSDTDCNRSISLDLDSLTQWKKVLGLVWNPYSDSFSFTISLEDQQTPTKRKLLSEVAKIFDPIGFLAPSTILFKILFQELWTHKNKIGWDDLLPTDVAEKWKSYRKDLPCFENLRIQRRCTLNSKCFHLIGFCDASEKAYGAIVYARSVSESGVVEIQLVAAKTRVAPVKQLSVPRLELCGALLLSRLIKLINSSLDVKPVATFAFTDSQIVLAWFSSPPRRWNTFVANRTSEILDTLPRSTWNYIRSGENPADLASRGVEPNKLLGLDLWWKGPGWMCLDISHWPLADNQVDVEEVPEERKIQVAASTLSCHTAHFMENLANNVSSWSRLLRIVAFVQRFVKNCKIRSQHRAKSYLSCSEVDMSKQFCLQWIQSVFQEEIHALNVGQQVSTRSKLCSLSPFVDEVGLLRVGGRIANAVDVPFSIKHPIILPKHNPLTKLILIDAHVKFLHAGISLLFSLVRQEYWIIGCRNLIRKIVNDCLQCFRQRQHTSTQLMGDLPSSRLSPSYAFVHTGCDYAGPITLRLSKGRKPKLTKGYLALFVCMVTKALHLEVVSDLTTEAFMAALRRFISRRGKCSVIYTDNGTNFQGAARILSEMHKLVRSREHNDQVATALAAENIKWEFIPPHSPHFGGLWESGVKCVKQHLRRVVGNNILTFEEISTLLAQIEALLNSRPLCAISDSDLNPLTPSHFLIGRPYTALPEPNYMDIPENRLGRWELVQNMMQGFWHRWHMDYLTSLQQRPKWRQVSRDFKVGDLVVVKEPNSPPSKWSLGRVECIHPGHDGHVRVVSVKTTSGLFKRPITKLAILPCS